MNSLTRLGFLVSIAGGLLAVVPPMSDSYLIVKLLFLAAGGALIWAGLFAKPAARTALDLPLAAFGLATLLSAAFSVDRPASVFGLYPQMFYGVLPLALCAQLFYAAAAVAGDENSVEELVRWMLAASIPLSAFGISQRLFGDLLTHYALPAGNRITSTIGSPVMLGACLVVLIPLALDDALRRRGRLGTSALALMLAALVLTWSRGAWACAAAAVAAYFWITGRLRPSGRGALWLVLAGALALAGVTRALRRGNSDAQRVETTKTCFAATAARPLLGWGPDTFVLAFRRHKTDEFIRVAHETAIVSQSAHNDLLQVLVTMGLLGLLAYAWLNWALGARLFALCSSKPDGRTAAIAASLVGLFLQAKLNPIPSSALALGAILAGLVCRERAASSRSAGRAAASLAAVFCAGCVMLLARFCSADVKYRNGGDLTSLSRLGDPNYMAGVNELREATELNPWVMEYLSKRCDVIFRTAPFTPPEQGRQLMEKAIHLAEDGVRMHPNNPSSHVLLATALALATRYGGRMMPEASAEIRKATEQDPTMTFTLRRRMDIDRAIGDQADFEKTRAEYLRVVQLTGEAPNFAPLIY